MFLLLISYSIIFQKNEQILFEEGTKNAIGVKYERFGKMVEVKADKEVILSAGAIETPKLLMLSGIGPEEDLEQLEV